MKLKTFAIALAASTAFAQIPPPATPIPNGPAPVLQQGFPVTYTGSVPAGAVSTTPISLSLHDAIQRGLRYNLGILVNNDITNASAAERRRTLSTLLPQLSAGFTQVSLQEDLAAFGLNLPGFPIIVGPFGYQDARAYFEQTVYDRPSIRNLRSANESLKAARLNAEDARNLVVQAVSDGYVAVITDEARVTAIQAEVETAQTLYNRANDQHNAGTAPAIEVLRANVELKSEQQRLLAQRNQVEKDKLALARAIGLPVAQAFTLTDTLPFSPVTVSEYELLREAYDHRPDYKAAQANVRAAQYAVEAAKSEQYWPQAVVQGDYGIIGSTLGSSHGTYDLVAGVRIPIFAGNRARADIATAESVLSNKRTALEDLRGRIAFEVRSALLDLESYTEQVSVARSNVALANEALGQSRDRFTAGVADNLEVVQAQQSLALANEDLITALGAHNEAKIALATAVGVAEQDVPRYLNLK